ncbi:MAG: Metal dependent phosphohydrolase [Candidatus Roizmanbacteria bacterium GW2011_GWA2_35_19]|uniref:Metal dependent phosphohydrolase n=2 Tax=Candidatus Roizmaniibacteriota TaxID=1752723 RepID=A0A0G0EDB2_9BACT|nr:MAG: Metal dependent phosphohydrolase [Candidatus Roizmanbacteria bacterium GW2011_GWC2_35_12]KKP73210.1 MAG: Metal dependent phosphohydrolase [Candidatus Roizmanbacteria bacterium GW2011_GWA2_35_19]
MAQIETSRILRVSGHNEIIQSPLPKTPEQLMFKYTLLEKRLDDLWTKKIIGKKGIPKIINESVEDLFKRSIPSHISLDQVTNEYLLPLLDIHNKTYADHSRRVAKMTYNLAFDYGLKNPENAFTQKELTDLYYSALLHDIGKIVIPNSILDSQNGQRGIRDIEITRDHTHFTGYILSLIPQTRHLAYISALHHERQKGNGYYKVDPNDISPLSQFITMADYFDAITNDRIYQGSETTEEAYIKMVNQVQLFIPLVLKHLQKSESFFEKLK